MRTGFYFGARTLSVVLLAILVPLMARAEHPTFAVVSDSHVGAANTVYPAFIRAVEEAGIGIVIHTGDAINTPGSRKQWASFLEATGPALKLHLTPGNHDVRGKTSFAAYLKHFPKPYYSFFDDDTLFVLVNTELPGEEAMVTGEQFAWLETELERPFRYKFVFLHEPLFPVVPLHGLDRHLSERDRLHRLFVRSGVCLVVAGHDHVYSRITKDGITYVIAGPTGGTLPAALTNGDPFRYMVVTGKSDGYSFLVKDMAGNRRDEFFLGTATERRRANDRPHSAR
jgi:3',5'-cyclic AMP phosphodiesterase CpdA